VIESIRAVGVMRLDKKAQINGVVKILIGESVFASLRSSILNGIVEAVHPIEGVKINTAYGNININFLEMLEEGERIKIELRDDIIHIRSKTHSFQFEVQTKPIENSAERAFLPSGLMATILDFESQKKTYPIYFEISPQNYITEFLALVTDITSSDNVIRNIWFLSHNLSYSLLYLPIKYQDEHYMVRVFKENSQSSHSKKFRFEWESKKYGDSVFEAVINVKQKNLDLRLITESVIEDEGQSTIREAYAEHLDLIGYNGALVINIKKEESMLSQLLREHCKTSAFNLIV
jgi:hypothetical protein